MSENWDGKRAKAIPVMPDNIPYGSIETDGVAIGLSAQDIEPVEIDFDASHYLLISGKPQSGKSNMIKVIAKQMCVARKIIFDTSSSLKSLCDEHTEYFSEPQMFDDCISKLVGELENRRTVYQSDNGTVFPKILILIDDMKQFFDGVSNDTVRRMYAITRIGKGLGVYVVAAGMYDDLLKLSNQGEQFTCALIGGNCAVALGGRLSEHEIFKVSNLSFDEKSVPVNENEGYVIIREKAEKFRAMYEK